MPNLALREVDRAVDVLGRIVDDNFPMGVTRSLHREPHSGYFDAIRQHPDFKSGRVQDPGVFHLIPDS